MYRYVKEYRLDSDDLERTFVTSVIIGLIYGFPFLLM